MKCPYCGGEVKENTTCKYCDSFVASVEKVQVEAATPKSDSQNALKSLLFSILKWVGAVFGIKIGLCVLMFVLLGLLVAAESMLLEVESDGVVSDAEETVKSKWASVTDEKGKVKSLKSANITIETEDGIFETILTDKKLLGWLEYSNRNINNVDVLFSTDEKSNIDTLALSSSVFYVLGEQEGKYLITRDGDFFRANTEAFLVAGCFYEGYITYPDVSVYYANEIEQVNISLFDPICKDKREVAVRDAYSENEMVVWQIRTGDDWYFCTKELYDFCEVDSRIEKDVCIDREVGVIYIDE